MELTAAERAEVQRRRPEDATPAAWPPGVRLTLVPGYVRPRRSGLVVLVPRALMGEAA
jgi:hypothetical protein